MSATASGSAAPVAPTAAASAPIQLDLNPTIGADLIGIILSSILYGVTLLQTVFYYRTYTKDTRFLKFLVFFIWALDTLSLALNVHGVYQYTITDWGNIEGITSFKWSISSEPAVTSVIALIVELFLINRVRVLSTPAWRPWIIFLTLLAFVPFSFGIVAVKTADSGSQAITNLHELHTLAIGGDTTAMVLDFFVSSSICFLLWRSRTGWSSTDRMITMLTLYVVGSGLTVSAINLATLLSYLIAGNKLIFQAFSMLGSKAYVNSFLATLNARQSIGGIPTDTTAKASDSVLPSFVAASGTQVSQITTNGNHAIPIPSFQSAYDDKTKITTSNHLSSISESEPYTPGL